MFSTTQQSTKLCNLMIHFSFSPPRVLWNFFLDSLTHVVIIFLLLVYSAIYWFLFFFRPFFSEIDLIYRDKFALKGSFITIYKKMTTFLTVNVSLFINQHRQGLATCLHKVSKSLFTCDCTAISRIPFFITSDYKANVYLQI